MTLQIFFFPEQFRKSDLRRFVKKSTIRGKLIFSSSRWNILLSKEQNVFLEDGGLIPLSQASRERRRNGRRRFFRPNRNATIRSAFKRIFCFGKKKNRKKQNKPKIKRKRRRIARTARSLASRSLPIRSTRQRVPPRSKYPIRKFISTAGGPFRDASRAVTVAEPRNWVGPSVLHVPSAEVGKRGSGWGVFSFFFGSVRVAVETNE